MESIPDSVFGFILGNLKELVVYNYQLISGLGDNVDELCTRINTLNGFVKEYTKERHHQNAYLKSITDEIRGIVHKAEDLVETYVYTVSLHSSRHGFDKFQHEGADLLSLRSVAAKIAESCGRVEKILKETVEVGLKAAKIDVISVRPPKKEEEGRPAVETNVVGLDAKVTHVINLLEKESEQKESDRESEQLRVVSITGMFGLGKTTLAKEVLKDPRIHASFPDRAFVKVSQQYNRKKVFLTILDGFSIKITEEIKGMTDDRLAKEVEKELIKMKNYLIVLDDVWNKEAWNALQGAFPKKKGSVILITTRDAKVAHHANPPRAPYPLFELTFKQSKELLMKKSGLKSINLDLDPDLDDYASNIARKCKGLPLSIVVIAGTLESQGGALHNWEKVSNSVNAYVARDPEYTSLIRLSYDILPFHLKQCFLYLGVFHEGSEIPVWKLLRLWIAEGFVQPNGDISLEDIAEDYLEDLVARNLVMVSQRKSNGQIKTCLIHDMLHIFCKNEAIAENLFQETKGDEAATVIPASASYRRLYIKPELLGNIFSKHSLEYVRSFFSFAKEETPSPPENVSSISKGFKLLRVLDVKSIIFPSFPNELLSLVLLKYIAIFCKSNILPEDMSNLLNLQTVIFETSSRRLKVEADIWKMSQLRHLHTNSSLVLAFLLNKKHQSQSSQSKKLQTLCTISSECCTAEVFERTPNLNKLGIRGKLDTLFEARGKSCLFAGISKYIKEVKNLKLVNEDINSSLNDLTAESFPSRLRRLTLKNTRLNWEQMTTLGNLKFLQVLKLKDNAFQGEKLETTDGGFLRLRVLYIGATNLVEWKSSGSHFPILKSLKIRDCSKLKAIPSGVGERSSLQIIELYDTNPSLVDSATEIEAKKLQQEEGRGFKLSVNFTPSQSNSVAAPRTDDNENAAGDNLPTEGAISKATSEEFPPLQRSRSKQSITPNVNVQTTVPAKKVKKRFSWFSSNK